MRPAILCRSPVRSALILASLVLVLGSAPGMLDAADPGVSVTVVNVGRPSLAVRAPVSQSPDPATRRLLQARLSVAWEGVGIDEAVARLHRLTGLNLVLAPGIVATAPPIDLRLTEVTAQTVLDWLARQTGLRLNYVYDGIYISDSAVGGPQQLTIYDVSDLSRPIPHFPGPRLGYTSEGARFELGGLRAGDDQLQRPTIEDLAELLERQLERAR